MSAREVALQVVRDVFPASGPGRSAQESLSYRAQRASLDGRDRAFATELAYGTIKMRRALDWHLQPFLGNRPGSLPGVTHEILRLAMYELRYTRADVHATVYEFVEMAKRHGHRGLAGLANAVLRSALRNAAEPISRASFESDDEYLATLHSLPTWIVRQWRSTFGDPALEAICAGVNAPPQTAVTVNRLRIECEDASAALHSGGIETRRSAFSPESLIVTSAASLPHEASDGTWWRQSESSALAVEVLQPQPGENVADVCSGRGNKALQIGARMSGEGELVCVDRADRKMRVLRSRARACGIAFVETIADAREAVREPHFDRVLLDAPCSGIGVVGRHPEARWKKQSTDASRLAGVQAELLAAAADRLYDGGALVYAVCSTDPREGIDVVEAFLRHAKFSRGLVPSALEPFLTGDGDVLVPPGIEGRDGFYVARLERAL